MGNLDLTFLNWDLISKFIVNGFWFSVQLTIIATRVSCTENRKPLTMKVWMTAQLR